jgi:basic membrane protein A and related proteins
VSTKRDYKRMSLLVLFALIATTLLVACGSATNTVTAPKATTAAAVSATTAAAGATTGTSAGGKKLKVGLVTDIGKVDDKSFNQSAWDGVQKFAKDNGGEAKFIETTNTNDYAKNIGQFVTEKYDAIVTVGFLMYDATVKAAKENPSVVFIGVDQSHVDKDGKSTAPNLIGLIFEEDKAGFLAGVLAAGVSKSKKIGGVYGRKDVPAVARFGEGYKAGAEYLSKNNPTVGGATIQVTLVYHPADENAFTNPAWGNQQAKNLVQAGHDVVFGGGGKTGNGAVAGAAEAGAWVIGVDTDQYLTLPSESPAVKPKIISSAIKRITDGVNDILGGVSKGTAKGGDIVGPVGLAPYHDTDKDIPQAVKDAVIKAEAGLKNGEIKTNVKIS